MRTTETVNPPMRRGDEGQSVANVSLSELPSVQYPRDGARPRFVREETPLGDPEE